MTFKVDISGFGRSTVATFGNTDDVERIAIGISGPYYHVEVTETDVKPYYEDLGHFLLDASNGCFLSRILPFMKPSEVAAMCARAADEVLKKNPKM